MLISDEDLRRMRESDQRAADLITEAAREAGQRAERERLRPLLERCRQIINREVCDHTETDKLLTALRAELGRE